MPRIPIRTKLAASLAVPLLALVIIGVFEVRETAGEVSQVRDETRFARAINGPAGVITRLQDERTWMAIELNGLEGYDAPMEGYPETRAATDEAIEAFTAEIEDAGGAIEETYRDALASLGALGAIRSDIDALEGPRSLDNMEFATAIYDRYAELAEGMLDASAQVPLQVDDAELRAGVQLANLAARQIELDASISRETTVAATLSPNGIDTTEEIASITTLLTNYQLNNDEIKRATGRYAGIVEELFPADLAERLRTSVEAAILEGTIDDVAAFIDELDRPADGGYTGLRDAFVEEVGDRADDLNADATTRQRLFVALTLLGIGVAALMTWLVSRSITRPLRSLTEQAKEMAERRLPETVLDILETPLGDDVEVPHVQPVMVRTRDEVADVSAALNTVQVSALNLAVEQAVLRRNIADSFVNLGRRNQNLLGRQLDFITQLESHETDPDTLASLFRLDHLATRMRRNAESLLVLAGVEPPGQWALPVRLTDVVRAALGEVENYRRVRIDGIAPATVVGSVAADLAHLLAELIENALTFSPPEEDVAIRGWRADADRFRLLVIDRGFGMAPSALAQANRRLARAESFTVAPSKYLGHYVAGNLAARHGIHIRLDAGSGRGIEATVDLPSGMLTSEGPTGEGPITGPQPVAAQRAVAAPVAAPYPGELYPAPGVPVAGTGEWQQPWAG